MTEHEGTRRGFLSSLAVLLAGLPIVGGLFAALRAGLAPAHEGEPGPIPLCRLADVPADDVLVRPIGYRIRRGPAVEDIARIVLVTRDADGSVIAMSGECTHLTCPVDRRDVRKARDTPGAALECPCHGGRFSRTGEVLAGPPPRPLRRLRVQVPDDENGMIQLLET
jgi:succinate dehydrogenase / fumarate reductase iron-sulfur subunit